MRPTKRTAQSPCVCASLRRTQQRRSDLGPVGERGPSGIAAGGTEGGYVPNGGAAPTTLNNPGGELCIISTANLVSDYGSLYQRRASWLHRMVFCEKPPEIIKSNWAKKRGTILWRRKVPVHYSVPPGKYLHPISDIVWDDPSLTQVLSFCNETVESFGYFSCPGQHRVHDCFERRVGDSEGLQTSLGVVQLRAGTNRLPIRLVNQVCLVDQSEDLIDF